MTRATRVRAEGRAGTALRAGTRLTWVAGWLLSQRAADASVVFSPTEEALAAARDTLPYGYAGASLMLVAALTRFAYRGWLSALWFSLLPVVTLVLFFNQARGEPFAWQLLTLLAAVALLTYDTTRDYSRRRRRPEH